MSWTTVANLASIKRRRELVLALYLGLMSLAAVAEQTIKCHDEPIYLKTEGGGRLMLEDGSGFLILEQKRRECRLALGNAFAIKRTEVTQNRA